MATLPRKCFQALEWRNVTFCSKACAREKVPRPSYLTVFGGDDPLIFFLVKLRSCHPSVELTILFDVELLVDKFEVLTEFLPGRKALGPGPLPPDFFQRELVQGNVAVDSRAWVAIVIPDLVQIISQYLAYLSMFEASYQSTMRF